MNIIQSASLLEDFITNYAVRPLLVVVIGVFAGKLLEQLVLFSLGQLKIRTYGPTFVAYLLKWFVYLASFLFLFHSYRILSTMLSVILFLVILVVGAAVALGLWDFFPNFANHHRVKAKHAIGSELKTTYGDGKVVSVQLTETHLKVKGDDIFVPNSSVARFRR